MNLNIDRIKWLNSLAKVFPGKEPEDGFFHLVSSFFSNEVFSIQCAYHTKGRENPLVRVSLGGSLAPYASVRQVCLMPVRFPGRAGSDGNYLGLEPGLYPDLLRKLKDDRVRLYSGQWQSLFITIDLRGEKKEKRPAGKQKIGLELYAPDGKGAETLLAETGIVLNVREQELPEQKLFHTEWFHTDCLADFYRVKPWSEAHWEILEHFISHYADSGMNTILVPTFTPALDTAVGQERTTVQLVDVREERGAYEFGFEKLERFIRLCRASGIRYFEIAHLFTQWGAKAAPKVMAERDGRTQRIFGWETDSKSAAYLAFLEQYLTALVPKLEEWGLRGRAFFHLSDEPEEADLSNYAFLKNRISGYLKGFPILDAVSRYCFYEQGIVDAPVPGIDHLEPFLEHEVPHLWTYYCNAQDRDVTNRFFSMPSARNRMLGMLLYYHGIEGFLHWGYNFYNSQFSLEKINPYEDTDAGGAFPSGDAFLVYPGADGYPEDSLRMVVLAEAMQDIRALELLEGLSSRENVLALMEDCAGGRLSMREYPKESAFLIHVRERVNEQIGVLSVKRGE